ncbi:uroporphyrinogen-III C-methyltransferase [Actomonas aquatica]|uniref:uroporphyrinogen-III C-methyltransferase n=1 Tax=Actomonas aquatica TaxID=2866162 RepID=A0ABZ1CBN1_9BACT|nr:uroporphyrinogen-III C-methyltransferase [Opitutus sp. WL0086]WRQ87984.1 uroporphyrinogen-III C-methyltransferase [Opitutus sp. WL0086]
MASAGIVYLVGAGPGDLGLVTFRARELIASADVLVYDYLVHPDLVSWCASECEVVYVGKKAGFHSVPQAEIEALLVDRAKAGKRVVRLKGGDPYVFGRGGEEARALAADGIRFEVVPGVTAALAAGAYAGIPLTHRNTSSSLVLVTGHEDPNKHELQVDWPALGALRNTTLAIYMGMSRLADIMAGLQKGGLAADTPAAVVQWASLGRQRSVTATVGTLVEAVAEAGLKAPSIIFVGDVVLHQETVDWFEHLSLFGRRIAITRTRGGNSGLREKLEHLGAEVVELPLINVVPDVHRESLIEIVSELGSYDWIVFTSANGVNIFFEQFAKAYDDVRALGLLRFACVGEATARAVRSRWLKVECQPEIATADALADALIATDSLDSAKVIVVTGNRNRETLVKRLEEEGRAIVDVLPLYRTEKLDLSENPAAHDFREKGADAILFASSSAVEAFTAQAKALALEDGAKRPLAGSIGPQTSDTMKQLGMPIAFEAKKPGLDDLVAALVARLAKD